MGRGILEAIHSRSAKVGDTLDNEWEQMTFVPSLGPDLTRSHMTPITYNWVRGPLLASHRPALATRELDGPV